MTEKKESFYLDEIVSIEDVGVIDTYDFTIPDTHCFYANGVLVHNTGFLEEHADVVLLLHWPKLYDANVDKNHFEINLAKNKLGATGFLNVRYYPEYFMFREIDNKPVAQPDWQP